MSVVGKSVERKDALDKVLGSARYVDDIHLEGTLMAKGVFSTEAHAKIKSVDITDAMKVEGVIKIITAKDVIGDNHVPLVFKDMPFLADGVVRYVGESIAWVAAETIQAAEEGARKVKVEYEPIEANLSIEDSLRENAPKIHPDGNIHKSFKLRKGDIEKGFAEADIIIENTYRTPYQEHAYIEPLGMIANVSHEGGITVYGSLQCPFYVQDAVSVALGLPLNKVRIVQCVTGGAFGGKEDVPSWFCGYAALLSWHTKRPVKIILNREDDLSITSKRHPSKIIYKTGAKKDGTLVAIDVTYYLDGGAYATLSPVVMWRGLVHTLGPYRCENVKVDAHAVATNLVTCGAYRGFGTPQVLFAHEGQMDILAEKLNMDPSEIRRINALKLGDITSTGQKIESSIGLMDSLEEALKKSGWNEKRELYGKEKGNKKKGIGISTVFYGVGLGAGGKKLAKAGAYVEINKDASVNIAVGTTELGQGMRTVLSQIAADAVGVPYEDVYMHEVDTSRVPDSGPTVASRSTVLSGNAIRDGARQLRETLEPIAEEILSIPPEDLTWDNGEIYFKGNPEMKTTFKKVVEEALKRDLHLARQGWFKAPYTSFDEETGQGWCYFTYAYATNIAEVEVDIKTGEVKVLRITAAHDVGKAVNPQQVEGQIQGGTLQAVGYATTEEILQNNKGKIINNNFSTYIIPTAIDAPVIDPIIIEHPFDKGPYGAKGFGELPLMGVAPAIASAVFHATGVRMSQIPITPERFMETKKQLNI